LFKNKTLDRISLAFAILSAWALSALYVWVFTTKTITYDAWGIMALLCAACHPLVRHHLHSHRLAVCADRR